MWYKFEISRVIGVSDVTASKSYQGENTPVNERMVIKPESVSPSQDTKNVVPTSLHSFLELICNMNYKDLYEYNDSHKPLPLRPLNILIMKHKIYNIFFF